MEEGRLPFLGSYLGPASFFGAMRSIAAESEAKMAALHFAHEWNNAIEDTARNCHAAHELVLIVKAACALDRHGGSSLGLAGRGWMHLSVYEVAREKTFHNPTISFYCSCVVKS